MFDRREKTETETFLKKKKKKKKEVCAFLGFRP